MVGLVDGAGAACAGGGAEGLGSKVLWPGSTAFSALATTVVVASLTLLIAPETRSRIPSRRPIETSRRGRRIVVDRGGRLRCASLHTSAHVEARPPPNSRSTAARPERSHRS